ncbi:hypothetical protein ACQ7CX_17600 [Chryseobacterium arthrosphaerae]|uniref:radical SAM protein n=1 Tax=Chryseobacterium arthrosphaerae TaxID=651561 RepID=UPI001BAE85D9|nr:radical SAM protein [Chryseobacterium arthrosphaerae]QUY55444.1 radical SAM protein [Chryseobacterium arthrosphaerae]
MNTINTEKYSETLRKKAIDIENKKILITNYSGSLQEKDLTDPANCNGFGRIRHFKISSSKDWPENPLPIIPAQKYLGTSYSEQIKAQIFQNSVCNWRCWYCFVDFNLLAGNTKYSSFLSCDELLNLYLQEKERPLMIDLSGGQPDLTPEWIPWMMESLESKGLADKIFLWSDDNLSNDYFWRYLTDDHINRILSYKMYARVCCFKGIDEMSFALNTTADRSLFHKQFDLFKRLWDLKIDLYGYITLTAPSTTNFAKVIPEFLDRIQKIDEKTPLKIVPLQIFEFTPVMSRKMVDHKDMLLGQMKAVEVWQAELQKRFTEAQRRIPISNI